MPTKPAPSLTLFLILAAALVALLAPGLPPALEASAPDGQGTIAYVRADSADEIRLVEPDGSNDRTLWAHGLPDPQGIYEVWRLDWRPNGTEVAFVSTHESGCSINSADVFAVGTNGAGYRRVTQAPACGALASYPQGTVKVPVRASGDFTGYVYFQGAPGAQWVSLPSGGTTVLTFPNVADFGGGFLQLGTMIVGLNREISIASAVDVQAGSTVTTAEMLLYTPPGYWEAHSPTWRGDGSKIGYVLNFNSLLALPPHPTPLDLGEEIVEAEWWQLPDFIDLLTWGPSSRANELLYSGNTAFDSEGIYLVAEGSTTAGQQLLSFEVWENVLGLEWLPDGSGFVYSRVETNDWYQPVSANLFLYTFASQSTTRLTSFTNLYAGMLGVSPDGQQIVFERGDGLNIYGTAVTDPDLWVINRDGSGLQLLVGNGRAPAWGTGGSAPPLSERIFLPLVKRGS